MPTLLSSAKNTTDYIVLNSDPHVPINTQIIATVYLKLH